MSKKDNFDIDFDDFSLEELEKLTEPEIKPLGIVVAIKYGNHWYESDLAFLSNEEFLDWCEQVLPVTAREEFEKSDLSSRAVRSQLFDQIVQFHSYPIFPKASEVADK